MPAITTHSDGAPIVVTDQLVRISDKAALQAFIQPVIVDSHAVLVLRDGHTTVRALGIGPKPVCYEKDMPMAGMNGPHVRVVSASAGAEGGDGDGDGNGNGNGNDTEKGNGLTFTIRVANPSPMEISFGECGFEIQNGAGEVFAELTGALDTRCGQFEATLRGTVNKHVSIGATTTTTTMSEKDKAAPAPAPTPARLVGKRCFGAGWCDETLRQIDTPLRGMRRIFEALNLPYEVSEEEEMENEKLLSDEKAPVARVVEEPVRAASKLWPSRFWRTTVS